MPCLHTPSVTVDVIDCKRNPSCEPSFKKQLRSNHNSVDLINTLPNPIDHFATSLKKKMHVSRISTKFSCRLELLGSRFLRIYCFLVLGLDLAVGLVPDNLPNFCTCDFSMRLVRDNQVEWPSEHYFLICQIEDTNLMNIADTRTSSSCKCDLLVPICQFCTLCFVPPMFFL